MGRYYSESAASLTDNRVRWPNWEKIRMSPTQWAILHDTGLKRIVNAGRGFGKDWIVLFRMLWHAVRAYEERVRTGFERDGPLVHCAIAALSSNNVEPTWAKMRAMAPVIPGRSKDGIPNTAWNRRDRTLKLFGENQLQVSMVSLWDTKLTLGDGFDFWVVTEGKLIDSRTLMEVVVPMAERADYIGDISLVSTPDNSTEWDEWCEQARDGRGYFADWSYFHAAYWENPRMTDERRASIAAAAALDPARFEREFMARLRVHVPEGGNVECPITPELLECALTRERIVLSGPPLVAFDLAYGGEDKVVRGVWDRATCGLAQLDVWTRDDLRLTAENKHQALAKLFEDTARQFPGCTIVYDATGPNGSIVHLHVPRWVRLKPVSRNNPTKNKHVGDLLERIANVGADGKSRGIRLPDHRRGVGIGDGYPFPSETARAAAKELYEDLVHYRQVLTEVRGTRSVRYTKGQGWGDDTVDMVTIACSELPALRGSARVDVGRWVRGRFQ